MTIRDRGAVRTESPIEEDFLSALYAVSDGRVIFMPEAKLVDLTARASEDENRTHVFASSQVTINARGRKYRADFVLASHFTASSSHLVCVECDGREFHNAAKDHERDVAMIAIGICTVRFSGSRLRRDAFQCAHEALEAVKFIRPSSQPFADSLAGAIKSAAWNYERAEA